ncbi:MAG: motility protein A [Spirochaetales bacterium]|jgi:chemotaxis protein MotA|nr:motility protein A [Spirochaetales bacterium]
MDIGTLGGIVIGSIVLITGVLLGGAPILIYWDLPSVFITLIGSMASLFIAHPLKRVLGMFKLFTITTKIPKDDTERNITVLVEFSERARREGLLALEDNVQELEDEFMRKGIQLVVDGTDPEVIKTILFNELNQVQARHEDGIKIYEDWGKFCPAFGMIGTLIGLIAMLANLQDKSAIGSGMAVALITTLYGAIAANFIIIPLATKLGVRHKSETALKEIIIEGILSIQAGDNPRILQEKLLAFLPPVQREALRNATGKD